jgi:hypothetical protein
LKELEQELSRYFAPFFFKLFLEHPNREFNT